MFTHLNISSVCKLLIISMYSIILIGQYILTWYFTYMYRNFSQNHLCVSIYCNCPNSIIAKRSLTYNNNNNWPYEFLLIGSYYSRPFHISIGPGRVTDFVNSGVFQNVQKRRAGKQDVLAVLRVRLHECEGNVPD